MLSAGINAGINIDLSLGIGGGGLSKLQIIAYKDDRFQSETGSITVPVNPDKYSRTVKVAYNTDQEQGTQGNNTPYNRTHPEEIQCEFLFDGTGAIPESKNIIEKGLDKAAGFISSAIPGVEVTVGPQNIQEAIDQFKETVFKVEGDIHRPRFLKLLWGSLSFNCVLKDLKIDYTLFQPDGTPLRATLQATFMQVIEEERRAAEQGYSSPDLTHVRHVKEGDTLPLMAQRIYGDPGLYIQVAKFNGLVNFRNLKPNMRIVFPPVDKTAP